jgi:hypothetical protein
MDEQQLMVTVLKLLLVERTELNTPLQAHVHSLSFFQENLWFIFIFPVKDGEILLISYAK